MSCYFSATIRIKGRERYEAYRTKAGDMARKHGGIYPAVDDIQDFSAG